MHQHLVHQSPERHLGVGYQSQRRLDVEHRLGEEHHRCEEHRPELDEHLEHLLDEEHHLGEGRAPCPGWS